MGIKALVLSALAAIIVPIGAGATIVDGGSYGVDATGNRFYNVTFNAPTIQYFNSLAAGTLHSFTIWIDTASNALIAGEGLELELYGNFGSATAALTDQLAATSFSHTDLLAGPTIIGGDGATYTAAIWDMSALGVATAVESRFGVRAYAEGPSGQFKISGNLSGPGSVLPSPDPLLGLSRFSGSQVSLGNNGNPVDVWGYELLVDAPAPVPLPAGLPLVLSALAIVGIRQRKGPR